MSVNIRLKYLGSQDLLKKNRPYKAQLDYSINGKRKREVIKDVTFYPNDSRNVKKEKERIVETIRSKLEIELGNSNNGLVSRQLLKGSFILYFEKISNKKDENTKLTWDSTLKHIKNFQGNKLSFEDVTVHWIESFIEYLKNDLSNNSILTYLNKLNATLNQAVKEKIILDNPFRYINKPRKEKKRKEKKRRTLYI